MLDDTAFAGLEYTLPANWKQLWMTPLPAAAKPDAEKFSASRNLIIDVDPAFRGKLPPSMAMAASYSW